MAALVEATGLPREQALTAMASFPPRVTPFKPMWTLSPPVRTRSGSFLPDRTLLEKTHHASHGPASRTLPVALQRPRYFTSRLTQGPEDAEFALAWVVRHAHTREQQALAHAALRAKCDILWAQLDALYFAYVNPGWPPPGAFQPEKTS